MKNINLPQPEENKKTWKQIQQELDERSRERQREFLPIIKERNKKFAEVDKAKRDAKEREEKAKKEKRRQQIETLKAYTKAGKTCRECAELMDCSTGLIDKLRKEAIASNIWFTEKELEEIAELKNSRKKRKK